MNNEVTISGIVTSVEFDHEIYGEKFYMVNLSVERQSGISDNIPVMVSDRYTILTKDKIGEFIKVIGQFRSYNKAENERKKLVLFVFAEEIIFDEPYPVNNILLEGYICKQPTFRQTPLGRQISDVILAVNRTYGKSDYIPIVVWGRNAKYASNMDVGDYIHIKGRIQSREYVKNEQIHIAYEVSTQQIEKMI